MKKQKESGFALISVLVIVALVGVFVSELISKQERHIERVSYINGQSKVFSIIYALENWVSTGLEQDKKENDVDHLSENWAFPVMGVNFGHALLSGNLEDLNSGLNLNNVLLSKGAEREFWSAVIDRYAQEHGVAESYNLSSKILDWTDKDGQTSIDGAETDIYLLQDTPYRTSNRLMVGVSEVGLLLGWKKSLGFDWNKFEAGLHTAPTLTKVNVNTVSKSVYMAIFPDALESDFDSWEAQRKESPARSLQEFIAFMRTLSGNRYKDMHESFLTVSSEYFVMKSKIELGDLVQHVRTYFYRGEKVSLLYRALVPFHND